MGVPWLLKAIRPLRGRFGTELLPKGLRKMGYALASSHLIALIVFFTIWHEMASSQRRVQRSSPKSRNTVNSSLYPVCDSSIDLSTLTLTATIIIISTLTLIPEPPHLSRNTNLHPDIHPNPNRNPNPNPNPTPLIPNSESFVIIILGEVL